MAIESKLTALLNKKKWIVPLLFGMMCFYLVSAIAAIEIKGFDNVTPTFGFSIGGNLCAMFVALMLTLSILPNYRRQSGNIRIFVTLLTIGCSTLYLDIAQMVVDSVPEIAMLNKVFSILVYITETFFIFFFWLYALSTLKSDGKTMRVINIVVSVLMLIFAVLPIVNFFYPLYFSIDANGVYARNPNTWWICRIFAVLVIIFIIVALCLSKEKRKTKIIISVFIALPITAVAVAGYKYGVSLLYSSMMISLLMIYAFLYSDNEKQLYSTTRELGIATNIQKHMLPSIFPAFPDRKEFDIYALMDPAKEVGGDFYDFFLIDDTHLGMVIADVSDKGVPAALFMMASKIMVQNYAMMGLSPKEVLEKTNQQICSNNQDEMFVTIWFGVLDLKTGILTAANGGHEKPILKQAEGDFHILEDKHGFVVGWLSTAKYEEYTIKLEKGAKLFLYTDGVPESMRDSKQFGMDRTLEVLNKYKDTSPEEINKNLLNELTMYMGNNNQFDDITMICLEYRGYDGK